MENEMNINKDEVSSLNPNSIKIFETGQNYLLVTSNWTKFFAIIGFIFLGLMIFMGVMMLFAYKFSNQIMETMSNDNNLSSNPNFILFLAIFYLISGIIFIIPFTYLNRFSTTCRRAIMLENDVELEESLFFMRGFWKFIGILTVIYIVLMILSLPFMLFLL